MRLTQKAPNLNKLSKELEGATIGSTHVSSLDPKWVAVSKIINEGKADERRARNHRLIQQGLLLDFAGLEAWDRGLLLGALLSMGKSDAITPEKKADWKRAGDALLAQKEAVAI